MLKWEPCSSGSHAKAEESCALNVVRDFIKLRVIDLLRQDLFLLAGGLFFLSRDVLGSSWEFLAFYAKYRSCWLVVCFFFHIMCLYMTPLFDKTNR